MPDSFGDQGKILQLCFSVLTRGCCLSALAELGQVEDWELNPRADTITPRMAF